ncbi:MAG: hypothetical protein Q9192_002612 [Flavoplaca navasiana]
MNDQPPPYEEISSAPAYRNGSGRGAIEGDERGAFQQLSHNHITNEIHPINQPSTDDTHIKLLIPSTRPTILQFPYHPYLSSLGISELEWTSFISALKSAATLSGAQKAKAISAAVAAGLVVNPWLGVVIGMWIWRREVRGLVLAGERGEDGEESGVGRVLGEWNQIEESAKMAVKEQVVASVRNVESADDAVNRRVVTKEENAVDAKAVGHGNESLNGRGDRGFKLLVESIEDTDQKADDLEKRFAG